MIILRKQSSGAPIKKQIVKERQAKFYISMIKKHGPYPSLASANSDKKQKKLEVSHVECSPTQKTKRGYFFSTRLQYVKKFPANTPSNLIKAHLEESIPGSKVMVKKVNNYSRY